ncbi:hypothetical protein KY342_04530 [Candidatus Woesearchaeota archaeon]|nr:hypothetical protein [Candidatus Woesearchaeota archaeon]
MSDADELLRKLNEFKPRSDREKEIRKLENDVNEYERNVLELTKHLMELSKSGIGKKGKIEACEKAISSLSDCLKKRANFSVYNELKGALISLKIEHKDHPLIGLAMQDLENLVEGRKDVEDYLGFGCLLAELGNEIEKEMASLVADLVQKRELAKSEHQKEKEKAADSALSSAIDKIEREGLQFYERANSYLEKAVEKRGDWYDHRSLGLNLIKLGGYKQGEERVALYERAIQHFEETIKTKSDDYEYSKIQDILLNLDKEQNGNYQFKKTVQELEVIVKKKDNEEDYYLFGVITAGLGDAKKGNERIKLYETAINNLKEGVKKKENSLCFPELKDILVKLNKEQKDNQLYKTVIKELEGKVNERNNKDDYFWFALILERVGLLEKSVIYSEKSVNIKREGPNCYVLGIALSKLGDTKQSDDEEIKFYEKAISYLEESVRKSNTESCRFWLGETLLKLGNVKEGQERIELYKRAIPHLEEAVNRRGSTADHFSFGAVLSNLGDEKEGKERIELYKRAIPHLEEAVNRRENPADYDWLGKILSRLGDEIEESKERIEYYKKAVLCLENAKDYSLLDQTRSKLEEVKTKYNRESELRKKVDKFWEKEEALPYLEELVKVNGSAENHRLYGINLWVLGKNEEAIPHFRIAVEKRGFRDDYYILGDTFLSLGNSKAEEEEQLQAYENAVKIFEVLLEKKDNRGRFGLAKTWLKIGDLKKGKEKFECYKKAYFNLIEDYKEGICIGSHLIGKTESALENYLENEGEEDDFYWMGMNFLRSAEIEKQKKNLNEVKKYLKKSLPYLEKAVEMRGNAEDHFGLAMNLVNPRWKRLSRKEYYEKAVSHLKLATEMDGKAEYYHNLGTTLVELGVFKKEKEAIQCYSDAVSSFEKEAAQNPQFDQSFLDDARKKLEEARGMSQ